MQVYKFIFIFLLFASTASAHTFTANGEATTQGTTVKFGSGAADYTGAGNDDYITAPDSTDFLFGANVDFTVEGWVYINANGSNGWIAAQSGSGQESWALATYGGGTNPGCYFSINDGTGDPWDYADFPNLAFPQNQWVHCAMARNGGTIIGCEDGTCATLLTGFTQSLKDSTASMTSGDQPAAADFKGYVDEIRVSKGIARYTGNFTPSSSAFTCDAESVVLLHFDGNFTDSGAGGCAAAAVPLIINRPGVIFFDSDD